MHSTTYLQTIPPRIMLACEVTPVDNKYKELLNVTRYRLNEDGDFCVDEPNLENDDVDSDDEDVEGTASRCTTSPLETISIRGTDFAVELCQNTANK